MEFKTEIQERDQVIEFLTKEYAKATGKQVALPYKWERFVEKSELEDIQEPEEELSFTEAVKQLKLPKPNTGRRGTRKPKKVTNIQKIILCDFWNSLVPEDVFSSLVEGIKLVPSVETVALSNNNLTEKLLPQLEELFLLENIKCINLSNNNLRKRFATKLGELLKGSCDHIETLDISRNPFSSERTACISIANGVRKHPSLKHFSITLAANTCTSVLKAVSSNRNIQTLELPHSKLTEEALQYLTSALTSTKAPHNLETLKLSHCFLQPKEVIMLAQTVAKNKFLKRLDLSYNGITDNIGKIFMNNLKWNRCLEQLNLKMNNLEDATCFELAKVLRTNKTLKECNLGGNFFSDRGAEQLELELRNREVYSLGELDLNTNLSITSKQKLKGTTKVFKNSFSVLKPLEETNPFGCFEVLPWNLNHFIEM
mmetsp:Transcript_15915/g.23064  ORF Transcript_15915/g.23064 Transcript_15915/m.23064 type:complete len:428 (+) Transcript_15915:995-2278(+)